ncbi:MAG TPA: hypothetical protein VEJ87_00175, partial [Acidimicrobiales bacterium]|nr:hypothetical protein [Acidimicrobiales bacterium]
RATGHELLSRLYVGCGSSATCGENKLDASSELRMSVITAFPSVAPRGHLTRLGHHPTWSNTDLSLDVTKAT